MKVFNLTDIPTGVLEQRGLVKQHIAVGGRMVAPGEFVEIADNVNERAKLEYLVQVQACSIDKVPPPYMAAKQAKQAEEQPQRARSAVPVAHVPMAETRTAGEPPPDPNPVPGEQARLERHDPTRDEPEDVGDAGSLLGLGDSERKSKKQRR